MNLRRLVLLVLLLSHVLPLSAQADGQFCVQAFEDRNGNGGRDAGEPFLQRGVNAHLLNESNVIIGTALLDNAPDQMRVNGVICFQFLEAGQYTIEVTTAEYQATTPTTLTTRVNEGDIPAVLEFGARSVLIPSIAETAAEPEIDPEAITMRIAFSALAAGIAVMFMMLVGLMIYLIAYRGRTVEVVPDVRYRRPNEN
jgi:hypothetical protein